MWSAVVVAAAIAAFSYAMISQQAMRIADQRHDRRSQQAALAAAQLSQLAQAASAWASQNASALHGSSEKHPTSVAINTLEAEGYLPVGWRSSNYWGQQAEAEVFDNPNGAPGAFVWFEGVPQVNQLHATGYGTGTLVNQSVAGLVANSYLTQYASATSVPAVLSKGMAVGLNDTFKVAINAASGGGQAADPGVLVGYQFVNPATGPGTGITGNSPSSGTSVSCAVNPGQPKCSSFNPCGGAYTYNSLHHECCPSYYNGSSSPPCLALP